MNKLKVVISSPVDTYSGYGARARDFIKAVLAKKEEWDVKLLSQRWGNTRFGYLDDHNESELKSLVVNKIEAKPDIWIQITVPNEFQPVGQYNIGVTASIETTICHASWVQGVNRMNLVLTSSEHGKRVFENSTFEVADKQGNKTGEVKLEKPVEVLFEGVDISKYKKVNLPTDNDLVKSLNGIKESFCFLIVGHWLQGSFGHDRKNIGMTIERFLSAFKHKQNKPALIIKTQSANSGILDRSAILKKIDEIRERVGGKNLPNIYLLHGELSDTEINYLYNHPKVKVMTSLTKGEGFGRPLLEFAAVGKPIIASGWSGHTDFLRKDLNLLVGGNLDTVDQSAQIKDMILAESKWFNADPDQALNSYKMMYKQYKKFAKLGLKQASVIKRNWSFDNMADKLDSIFDAYIPKFSRKVDFKLPPPTSIKLPSNKIKIKQ
jgi:glycosyltransferase involved in cell wall biosynthesis